MNFLGGESKISLLGGVVLGDLLRSYLPNIWTTDVLGVWQTDMTLNKMIQHVMIQIFMQLTFIFKCWFISYKRIVQFMSFSVCLLSIKRNKKT